MTLSPLSSFFLVASLHLGLPQDEAPKPDTYLPPEVGDIAPPLGEVSWYTVEKQGVWPDLGRMRGDVVIVHSWGYFCGSCVRVGVPMVVDLHAANRDEGVSILSLTCQVEDGQPDDHFVGVGTEMGIDHPMALASTFGEYSPYLNLNHQKNLTWCTVIGRHGAVVWKGDPSSDGEEFLEAVRTAVHERDVADLGDPFAEPLREALVEVVAGDYPKALKRARKISNAYGKKKGDDAAAVAADAARLIAWIEEHQARSLAALESALQAGDAEAFVRAHHALVERHPKTDAAKRAAAARKEWKATPDLLADVEAWETWLALERERPVLFPARADKAGKRYAKALRSYLSKNQAGPGAATAAALVEAFELLE